MRLAPLIFLLGLMSAGFALAKEPRRSPLTSHLRSVLSLLDPGASSTEAPSHPLIIRIHEKALADSAGDKIDTLRPVSCVILGTPVSGRSRTIGNVHVDADAAKDSADFLVSFRGKSASRTIGVNGPARIYSHTITDFTVSRHVTFSPLKGFESKPTSLQTRTQMTIDDVQSARTGLGSRFIRRIAWRRTLQSRWQAERIADGNVRRELLADFNRQLDERVADLNRRFEVARFARAMLGSQELDIQVASSDNCVQLAVGRAGAPGSATVFPTECPNSAVEVWIHEKPLGDGGQDSLGRLWAALNTGMRSVSALQTLALAAGQPESPSGMVAKREGGWTVVSFDPVKPQNKSADFRLARRTPN